ncbi:hypothetical protein PP707_07735 [Acetobacter pasteurianus]|nr:hypothetical protein [Acetobacter pasteurianus]
MFSSHFISLINYYQKVTTSIFKFLSCHKTNWKEREAGRNERRKSRNTYLNTMEYHPLLSSKFQYSVPTLQYQNNATTLS